MAVNIVFYSVSRHGYGRWQAILDDKELKFQEVICQELNLSLIKLDSLVSNQPQVGSTVAIAESADSQKVTVSQNRPAVTEGTYTTTLLYQFREMQRRSLEFIKKRVLLLEKGLYAECQKECYGDGKCDGVCAEESENANNGTGEGSTNVLDVVDGLVDKLPRIEMLTAKEVYYNVCDTDPRRQELVQYYNEICKVLAESEKESIKALVLSEPDQNLGKKLDKLEGLCGKINQLFNPPLYHSSENEAGQKQQQDQRSEQPSSSCPVVKTETMIMETNERNETEACVLDVKVKGDVDMLDGAVDTKIAGLAADKGRESDVKTEKAEGDYGLLVSEINRKSDVKTEKE
ncbi:hypothetical protein KSS87_011395 [Heliosperma pusillum]|nr:hypothetical protein KSS87_011395 [Heliosperma pusillum]